jgi:hypothetical protein
MNICLLKVRVVCKGERFVKLVKDPVQWATSNPRCVTKQRASCKFQFKAVSCYLRIMFGL